MKTCDTLVIGCGYTALGMAIGGQNVLICEESETCDTRFYATFRSFRGGAEQPATEEGRRLYSAFEELGLLGEDSRDLCGFETAFCRYALGREVSILLKCRVVEVCPTETGLRCVLLNNAGLETVMAQRVVDTRCRGTGQQFSLLFSARDPEPVCRLFPEGRVEPAFQKDRWALHLPVAPDADYNTVLEPVCRRWETGRGEQQLLCFGSRLAQLAPRAGDVPVDELFDGPVAAFEAGLAFARREGL